MAGVFQRRESSSEEIDADFRKLHGMGVDFTYEKSIYSSTVLPNDKNGFTDLIFLNFQLRYVYRSLQLQVHLHLAFIRCLGF